MLNIIYNSQIISYLNYTIFYNTKYLNNKSYYTLFNFNKSYIYKKFLHFFYHDFYHKYFLIFH